MILRLKQNQPCMKEIVFFKANYIFLISYFKRNISFVSRKFIWINFLPFQRKQ